MVRAKNRYIVAKIILENDSGASVSFNDGHIAKTILRNVEKYYGDFGLGSVEHAFRVKYSNEQTRITIIRCRHQAHRFVTSILPLITLIADKKAKFCILYVGATITNCNKFIIRYQHAVLESRIAQIKSPNVRDVFLRNILDFALE